MNQPKQGWRAAHAKAVAGKQEGQADYIKRVAEQLNVITEETMARLPEPHFVEIFLPFFAKDPDRKYKDGIAQWISIAGSPYKEVDIFDPKTNEVLFRVPPYFDYNGVNPVRNVHERGQRPIADIVTMAEHLSDLHPSQGQAFLNQELGKRLVTMNTGEKLAQNVLRWNAIMKRYNRKPMWNVGEVPEAQAAPGASAPGPSTADEYEDF